MDLIKYRELENLLNISRTTFIRWSKQGTFPERKFLSSRISGWDRKEVYKWMKKKGYKVPK